MFNEDTFWEILLPSSGNIKKYADLDGNNKTYGWEEIVQCD